LGEEGGTHWLGGGKSFEVPLLEDDETVFRDGFFHRRMTNEEEKRKGRKKSGELGGRNY